MHVVGSTALLQHHIVFLHKVQMCWRAGQGGGANGRAWASHSPRGTCSTASMAYAVSGLTCRARVRSHVPTVPNSHGLGLPPHTCCTTQAGSAAREARWSRGHWQER